MNSNISTAPTVTSTSLRRPARRLSASLRRHARDLWWLAGVIGATLVVMFVLLKLWEVNMSVPFQYVGDASVTLMYIKDVIERFWYDTNPHLAAPFGQELYDYPAFAGDDLQLFIIKLLSFGSRNAPTVMNVFYLLTYPFAAFTAALVFRRLDISRGASAVCALLFAFLPFHFYRSEFHLFFSAYYAIPLGAYLILASMGGIPLFGLRTGRFGMKWPTRRAWITVLLCLIVGSASEYYAIFTMIILGIGVLLAGLQASSWQPVKVGAVVIVLVGGMLVVNYSPSFIYQRIHGKDSQVTERQPAESEIYSFRLIQLLLPGSYERIPALASKDAEYNQESPLPNNVENLTATLGIVGAVGFVWLLVIAGIGMLGARSGPLVNRLTRNTSVAVVIAFLLGTTGGLSALIAYLITPQIRAWARISPFISFFALIAIGVLLDAVVRYGRRRGWRPVVAVIVMAAVLAVGLFDQSSPTLVPAYKVAETQYVSDGAFVGEIQHLLPREAMVFQLPYEPFPPVIGTSTAAQYQNVRPYLHSDSIRWSYGAVTGRPGNWQAALVNQPLSVVLPSAAAVGFDGIEIEHAAYPDGGEAIEAILKGLPETFGFGSEDGTFSFFDLQAYDRYLHAHEPPSEIAALRETTLHPLQLGFATGFYGPEPGTGSPRWGIRSDTITIDNPARQTQIAHFSTILFTGYPAHSEVHVRWPEGARTSISVSNYGYTVERTLRLPPGESTVSFTTNASRVQSSTDPRRLYLRFVSTRLTPSAYTPFLGKSAGRGLSIGVEPAGELPET